MQTLVKTSGHSVVVRPPAVMTTPRAVAMATPPSLPMGLRLHRLRSGRATSPVATASHRATGTRHTAAAKPAARNARTLNAIMNACQDCIGSTRHECYDHASHRAQLERPRVARPMPGNIARSDAAANRDGGGG